jgi:hypothetical protein
MTLMAAYLRKHGVLTKISEHVRCVRRRSGRYEVIDFLAILFGYAISGERTLEEFYQRLHPFALAFMALFDRDQLPSRSALSRFLAALTEAPVEALRTLFLDDLLARPLTPDKQTGRLVDRNGDAWMVFDIDGTREAARQRALPQTDDLPPAFRRLDEVCAPGRGRAANAERWSGRAQRSRKRIAISGSARLATEATDNTAQSCARGVLQSSGISRPTSSPRLVPCSGSTANMATGPCSPMWLASRL